MSRWDVVQYSEVTEELHIGLPAFHRYGIDRVEFSLEGGPWTTVTEMIENPDTCSSQSMAPLSQCITEYTAKVRASDFSSSQVVEVRAVAYPNAGKPRLLPSLYLYIDKGELAHLSRYVSVSGTDSAGCGSSVSPCRTINQALSVISSEQGSVDRATVYLQEGEHTLSNLSYTTNSSYVTIEAAPGASRANVKLVGHNPSLNISKLRIKGVTWRATGAAGTSPAYAGHTLVLQEVHLKGDGQHSSTGPGSYPWFSSAFPWDGGMSLIDSIVSDAKFGPTMSYLQRNTRIERIGEDVFRYPHALYNVLVKDVHPGSSGWHSDLIEISGGYTLDNALFYGLHAYDVNAQAIFTKAAGGSLTQFKNSAFVNSLFKPLILYILTTNLSEDIPFSV